MKKLAARLASMKAQAIGDEIRVPALLMSLNRAELEMVFNDLYETCLVQGHDFKPLSDKDFDNDEPRD